jgi:hypothetical protein
VTDHQNDPQDVCQFYLDGFGFADVVFASASRSGASGGDGLPSGDGLTRPKGIAGEMVTVP